MGCKVLKEVDLLAQARRNPEAIFWTLRPQRSWKMRPSSIRCDDFDSFPGVAVVEAFLILLNIYCLVSHLYGADGIVPPSTVCSQLRYQPIKIFFD